MINIIKTAEAVELECFSCLLNNLVLCRYEVLHGHRRYVGFSSFQEKPLFEINYRRTIVAWLSMIVKRK
jgi:hypothetical protein